MSDINYIKDSLGVNHPVRDERLNTATTQTLGIVKPDGQSITIDNDGTIHGAASPFIKDSSGYINFNY